MELPEDCLNLIKEFAGPVHTSLDIMNCYRILAANPNLTRYFIGRCFSIKNVQYIIELLPYLVKKSKTGVIPYDFKSDILDHTEHKSIDRSEIIVAMRLAGYLISNKHGFQAEFRTQTQITRGLKKTFKFKYPAYKLEYSTSEYLPLLSYLVWKNTPFLRNKAQFQTIIDKKDKQLKHLNYVFDKELFKNVL